MPNDVTQGNATASATANSHSPSAKLKKGEAYLIRKAEKIRLAQEKKAALVAAGELSPQGSAAAALPLPNATLQSFRNHTAANGRLLAQICEMVREGTPFDTVVRALLIDRAAIEIVRRTDTPWGNHVNNSINVAEAQFERKIAADLLASKDSTEMNRARAYMDTFRPRFANYQKLRMEYEVNAFLEACRRHVDPETWLLICTEAKSIDIEPLMAALDDALLPKVSQVDHR